jgi:release factor glutamine methyltransferase
VNDATSIQAALEAASRHIDRIDARVLLRHTLGVNRAHIIANPHAPISDAAFTHYQTCVERRARGEPVAYIVGEREFHGLAFKVNPAVLIPRPETELLVDLALERLAIDQAARVLDLGTGSGAIAIAIAARRPRAHVLAVDASEPALALARDNANRLLRENHDERIEFARANWYDALGDERFDVIVSNPPYIAASDAHLARGDLRFEPRQALVGGEDGLDAIREIVGGARRSLRLGGWLLFEHGHDQGEVCGTLLREQGYTDVEDHRDLAGIARVACARAGYSEPRI